MNTDEFKKVTYLYLCIEDAIDKVDVLAASDVSYKVRGDMSRLSYRKFSAGRCKYTRRGRVVGYYCLPTPDLDNRFIEQKDEFQAIRELADYTGGDILYLKRIYGDVYSKLLSVSMMFRRVKI